MRNILLIAGVFLMLTSCTVQQEYPRKMSMNNVEEVNFDDPNIVLLDVRTPEEFEDGNIPHSVNLDFYSEDFDEDIQALDKDKTYFVYCMRGVRSTKAVKKLKKAGIKKVVNLKDGYTAYEENNQ